MTNYIYFRAASGNWDMHGVSSDLTRDLTRSVGQRTVGGEDFITVVCAEQSTIEFVVDDATVAETDPVEFTATVTPAGAGAVVFTSDTDGDFVAAPVDPETGEAVVIYDALTVATHSITASFYGDGTVEPSTSEAVSVEVAP